MRKLIPFILFLCGTEAIFAQNSYKKLLDTAVGTSRSIYVNANPITNIKLDAAKMWDYYNEYIEDSKLVLDTVMFAQIIKNSQQPDKTLWTDRELDKSILIKNVSEPIDINYVLSKFNITDKSQIKAYKKTIGNFNATKSYDRDIYSYSKPVFDDSQKYAIIQWDNGHNGVVGGGAIVLFHLSEDGWEELGTITSWKY
ncbi:MAG: hypothetical protein C5B59_05470 [Bacteroidetes bacterium]|nr:MAG: hypothetical protein C5B59_05470 [Bacteroidota bacterium]